MKYNYYIASRWRNKPLVEELVQKIRAKEKTVYSFFEGDGRDHPLKQQEQSSSPKHLCNNLKAFLIGPMTKAYKKFS